MMKFNSQKLLTSLLSICLYGTSTQLIAAPKLMPHSDDASDGICPHQVQRTASFPALAEETPTATAAVSSDKDVASDSDSEELDEATRLDMRLFKVREQIENLKATAKGQTDNASAAQGSPTEQTIREIITALREEEDSLFEQFAQLCLENEKAEQPLQSTGRPKRRISEDEDTSIESELPEKRARHERKL